MLMKIVTTMSEMSVGVLLVVVIVSAVDAKYLPRLSCKHESCQHLPSDPQRTDRSSYLVDDKLIIVDTIFQYLEVKCDGASVLDSPALPVADPALQVEFFSLTHCPLPANRSIVAILKAFNVTLIRLRSDSPRIVLWSLPASPPLAASHLIGVEDLKGFSVLGDSSERVVPESGFLAPLNASKMLLEIYLEDIEIHNGDLDLLPISLNRLTLRNVNVEHLSEVLTSLPNLQYLDVNSTVALSLHSVGPALVNLKLISPATSVNVTSVYFVRTLKLTLWTEEKPVPLASCDKLFEFSMEAPAVRVLPDGWFANCPRLQVLELRGARNLTTLPDKLLLNAKTLRELKITETAVEALPDGLFRDTPLLGSLILRGNQLLTLSSKMYLPSSLNRIDLASNGLDSINAVGALASLPDLRYLDLSDNPRLGDLCNGTGYSAIHKLLHLQSLLLNGTSVNRICIDWRLNMTYLKTLDLSKTNITKLSNDDLQFNRSEAVDAEVLLKGAPLKVVEITLDYYEQLKENKVVISKDVAVKMDAVLSCDCQMYWTRLALELRALDYVDEFRCANRRLLKDKAADELVCDAETECAGFEQLPASCACHWRPDTEAPGGVVHVNCSHSGLKHIPHLHASVTPPRHYHLLLADNNITQLHAADLKGNITVLDLRNNYIQRVDRETAEQLASRVDLLRLAGNPLQCDCNVAPLMSALHRRAFRTGNDIANATCHDGRPLLSVAVEECATSVPNSHVAYALVGGLAALLVIVIAVGASLGSRSRRFFLRAVLHRWGCLWRAAEPETDDARQYDAFITFSHEDEAVAIQLVRRLEPTYRLCVHYRDWTPGRLIAEQITESVETSRRTVALVSRNFINSAWARAEFRLAHAEALRDTSHRLIVVLLEDPEALPLDEQLSSYLKTNTFVRWKDPWFWDKLQVALPPARPPPASESISLTVNREQCLSARPPPASECTSLTDNK